MVVGRMSEIIIWIGISVFVTFIIAAVITYFESERFDLKYKKNIEIIRAIKTRKLHDFFMKYYEKESLKTKLDSKDDFPSQKEYLELGMKILESNRNLNRLMKKSADLKMWFDYLPRAKDFLVNAALWLFLLGLAILVFCLSAWAELSNYDGITYSGYLSFLWILFAMNFFKNILRYNIVRKNINEHMDKLRDGNVDKF
jgi:hypothetical protein